MFVSLGVQGFVKVVIGSVLGYVVSSGECGGVSWVEFVMVRLVLFTWL